MKKYTKDNTEVDAQQYDGTQATFDEIRNSVPDEHKDKFVQEEGERGERIFNIVCRTKTMEIYPTEWIVIDGNYFFVVSNDIFQDYFTEVV